MEYKKSRETTPKRVFGANVTPTMGEQPSMGERSTMGEQPSMGGQPSMWGQPSMGGQPSMWGQPSMGGQPSMWGQPPVMPGCPPQMMPRNPYSPNHRPPMMSPYPVYPSNMVMPYYYGDTLRGMEVWNDNDFTEEDLDKELEQIMEMYPSRAKEIQKKVVEVCDSIDYDGSIMYDEYPDKFVLSRYCDKIYQDMDSTQVEMASENLETQQVSGTARQGGGRGPCRNCRPDDGRRDLIDVLFFNEIFRRRCRKGKCRRW